MKKKLFTERQGMVPARVEEKLTKAAAEGLLALVNHKIDARWFGKHFPEECPDGSHIIGNDLAKMKVSMQAYGVIWPKDWPDRDGDVPFDELVFDLLEYSYEYVALPKEYGWHSFFQHDHLSYDEEEGRAQFAQEVNRIFERQGIAFELIDGEIQRLAPTALADALAETLFRTGDADLDRLLETAREKFLNKSLSVRKEGLEKLWDAWERLKTIEPGKDKKAQAKAILDRAATEPVLRGRLEAEAIELTFIGNNMMIRHTEVGKPPVRDSAQVDYLFHRMFALIRLLLKSSGRGG